MKIKIDTDRAMSVHCHQMAKSPLTWIFFSSSSSAYCISLYLIMKCGCCDSIKGDCFDENYFKF